MPNLYAKTLPHGSTSRAKRVCGNKEEEKDKSNEYINFCDYGFLILKFIGLLNLY